ncbi:MAG TPA: (2Fe-2S)-binding protein [Bradyrhizobium sp.]|jgi:isoquinoline 1-oxidoreductase subunit alpha|nr:(2Fe-2S)-binding protein [Bradyrhizobium sp.]
MITLNVNGQSRQIDADPNSPLLWALRDDLHLTGTKFGCGIAMCGACTVHVDGDAQRSCSVMVGDAVGKSITTIEGLSGDIAKAVTDAWIKAAVPQCGYCQPGFVMAVTNVLSSNRKQTKEAVLSQITNICRCGTYDAIRAAVGFAVADLNGQGDVANKEGVR